MSISPIGSPSLVVDGKAYTPPTGKLDKEGHWTSTPAEGMESFKTANNRQVGQRFDGQTFLKLLVAQLKYQDPTKPADSGQLLQQTATLSMVERINELASSAEAMVKASEQLTTSNEAMSKNYASLVGQQRLSSAVQLIGHTVRYPDSTGSSTVEGRVESVKFADDGPILLVGGRDVPLTAVESVTTAVPSAGETTRTSNPPAAANTP